MKRAKTKIYKLLTAFNQLKWSLASKGILVGLVAGLLAVVYRLGIEFAVQRSIIIYSFLKLHPLAIILWVAAAVGLGIFIAWLVKLEPMATGSGIPQVEGVVLYAMKMKWYTILAVRFIGGMLCGFFGLSLGREGPSIQIGSAGGQVVAGVFAKKNRMEQNYLITGGAAAGLSAAFNAPLSGMVFALEEIHRSFSPLILIAATTASLTADVVSKYFFGLTPVLDFRAIPQLPYNCYLWLIPLGVVSGLVGSFLNQALLFFQTLYAKLPPFLRPIVALLIALPCGLFLPQVLGGGQGLIQLTENAKTGIVMLLVFLAVKFLFTCTSFGSGVPGGIFLPILAVGTLAGGALGTVAVHLGLPSQYIADFAVCAMAGSLSACVKAPVTSILLTAEMSGTLVHMLPVAACAFIALLISDVLKVKPIYEALLERFVEKNGETLPLQERGGLMEFPVEYGSIAAGKLISHIEWPQGLLIVGLRRGSKELLPRGHTKVLPGDYLVILSSEDTEHEMRQQVLALCQAQNELISLKT